MSNADTRRAGDVSPPVRQAGLRFDAAGTSLHACNTYRGTFVPRSPNSVRSGMTLIELLVVIGIVALLAGMAITFLPALSSTNRGAQGASQLQGWLQTAKVMAARDRKPRGLRIIPDASGLVATRCQFVLAPEVFAMGQVYTPDPSNLSLVAFQFAPTSTPVLTSEVQIDDILEVYGGGAPHRITGVSTSTISLAPTSPLPYAIPQSGLTSGGSPNYKITRMPRIADEQELELPKNIVINLRTNDASITNRPLPRNFVNGQQVFDITFGPRGDLQEFVGGAYLYVHEWDPTKPLDACMRNGSPTIVTVNAQTGRIASYPADITLGTGPFGFRDIYALCKQ